MSDEAFAPGRHFYMELNPQNWRDELCDELVALLEGLLAREDIAVIRLGDENIKAPYRVALLSAAPSPEALAWLEAACAAQPALNFVADGVGCTEHYCEVDWAGPPPSKRSLLSRLLGRG